MTNREEKKWLREYETIYILRPDVDTESAEKVARRVTEVIDRLKGKLLQVDNWGRRKLEYAVQKHKKGVYVLVRYLGGSDIVAELERNLRMIDAVMKHQTVLMAREVDPDAHTVNPDAIKFAPIEPEKEEEPVDEAKITYRDADEYVLGKATVVGEEGQPPAEGGEAAAAPATPATPPTPPTPAAPPTPVEA